MIWLVMILTGLINFIFRISMFSGFRNIHVPQSFHRYVSYVPTSVLSAIIASSLITYDGQEISYDVEKLVAASIAVACALLTKSVSATLIVGLITVWLI
tara:strand:+ start:1050 stop:1346 length:297 start_codon:yes stop_codon:yes gene_type:complete